MVTAPYFDTDYLDFTGPALAPGPEPSVSRRRGGWFVRRVLDDGRELSVWSTPTGGAILCLGEVAARDYADGWVYLTLAEAVDQCFEFDPRYDVEPSGWVWHPPTGRRGAGPG